jgi:hypothetical protein
LLSARDLSANTAKITSASGAAEEAHAKVAKCEKLITYLRSQLDKSEKVMQVLGDTDAQAAEFGGNLEVWAEVCGWLTFARLDFGGWKRMEICYDTHLRFALEDTEEDWGEQGGVHWVLRLIGVCEGLISGVGRDGDMLWYPLYFFALEKTEKESESTELTRSIFSV